MNEKYTNTLTAGNCFLPGGLLGYQIVPLHMFGPMLPISWIVNLSKDKNFYYLNLHFTICNTNTIKTEKGSVPLNTLKAATSQRIKLGESE